jgi:hypothetical protein
VQKVGQRGALRGIPEAGEIEIFGIELDRATILLVHPFRQAPFHHLGGREIPWLRVEDHHLFFAGAAWLGLGREHSAMADDQYRHKTQDDMDDMAGK